MPPRDPSDAQVMRILRVLRQSLADVGKAMAGGGLTEFGQAEAATRRRAIERAIRELENRLPGAIVDGAAAAAQAAAVADVEVFGEAIPVSVEVDPQVVRDAQRFAAEAVANVSAALRRELNLAVLSASSGALTREQFDARIRDAFQGEVLEGRVERIARTELGRSFNAQQAANDQAIATMPGVELIKRWVSSGKGSHRARPEHDAIDGQERELDQDFDIGGGATAATPPGGGAHQAAAPLDARLPAEQVVNCGCRVVRVARSEARQTYIDRAPRNPVPAAEGVAGAPVGV